MPENGFCLQIRPLSVAFILKFTGVEEKLKIN